MIRDRKMSDEDAEHLGSATRQVGTPDCSVT